MVTLFNLKRGIGLIGPCKSGSSSLQRNGMNGKYLDLGWAQGPESRAFQRKSLNHIEFKPKVQDLQWYILSRNPVHWYMSGRYMVMETRKDVHLFSAEVRYINLVDFFKHVQEWTLEKIAVNSKIEYQNNFVTHCVMSPYQIKKSIVNNTKKLSTINIENKNQRHLITKLISGNFPHVNKTSFKNKEIICDKAANILIDLSKEWASAEGYNIEESIENWNINTA